MRPEADVSAAPCAQGAHQIVAERLSAELLDRHAADANLGVLGDGADLQQDLQLAARTRNGLRDRLVIRFEFVDAVGGLCIFSRAQVLEANIAAGRVLHTQADLIGFPGLQHQLGKGVELDVPVVARFRDSGRGDA